MRLIAVPGDRAHLLLVPNALRQWRKLRGYSRQRLADAVSCHMQTIRKLEDGEMPLNRDWAERLSKPLRVLPFDLEDFPPNVEYLRLAPVIAWASAGAPLEALAGQIDETTKRVAVLSKSPNLLAVEVKGSSMSAIAPEGSFAVFDRATVDLVDKGYYLFLIDGAVTFKKYRDQGGPPRLEPESTEAGHETIFPHGEVTVIGRVIEVVRTLL
jgi:SOS-response transcriptional repressor LexA